MSDNAMKALDNPVWEAINGTQSSFGAVQGGAALYDMRVSPFGGLQEIDSSSLDDMAALCSTGRIVALMYKGGELPVSDDWEVVEDIDVRQMVLQRDVAHKPLNCTELTEEFVDRMIELVKLTNPGPFGKRTIELGSYLGVLVKSQLMAMAGERFKPPGWVEISGVCSHPSAQGQGYAAGLVSRLIEQNSSQDYRAFLHVKRGSPSERTAVGVYQRLGFEDHQTMDISVLRRR